MCKWIANTALESNFYRFKYSYIDFSFCKMSVAKLIRYDIKEVCTMDLSSVKISLKYIKPVLTNISDVWHFKSYGNFSIQIDQAIAKILNP